MADNGAQSILNNGIATLHARAEAWECDFNGHWNTRYYCKNFQTAAEVARALSGENSRRDVSSPFWQLRFHSELHSGDPITVRSFNITEVENGPGAAHFMFCGDRIAATAIDYSRNLNGKLSSLTTTQAAQAIPRGLTGTAKPAWEPDSRLDLLYELGPVRQEELQANGELQFWNGVARMSNASHHHDLGLGFTLELMKQEGIGRMLAELRYTSLGRCGEGDFLKCASRMTAARGKAFTTAHLLYTHSGQPVAMIELCTLAVDMTARKAMELPGFVLERMRRMQP